MIRIISFTSILLVMFWAVPSWGQTIQTEFGKNRVQYHDYTWFEYETNNFRVYWYGDGRNVAHSAIQLAEWDYQEIQEILEHRLNRKIDIIVYVDITDLKQSNIGNEEAFVNTGGQTKIVENKVFVHFNGDHNDLRKQIREGITSVYLNMMMFGTNLQEMVQNAVLLNLPEWFTQGLISYVGEPWSTDLDNQLRDAFEQKDFASFEEFAAQNPALAGHSLWYYLESNYGRATLSNLLYLTRINRSVESGFLYVMGIPYNRMLNQWQSYFEQRYALPMSGSMMPGDSLLVDIRNKRNLPFTQSKLSPDGKRLVYVTNEIGKYKVYLMDLETGKSKLLFKGGSRNAIQSTDYNYPIVAWGRNNSTLGIIYERRDVIKFRQYNTQSNSLIDEQDFAPKYQRVFSMDYMGQNELVVSAEIDGLSDIFIYRINQRSTNRITNDYFDDLDAVYYEQDGKKGILFSSNRDHYTQVKPYKLDSLLPVGQFDIYYYALDGNDEKIISRVTDTPYSNEKNPTVINGESYSFLSNKNGVRNRYQGELESFVAYREKVVVLKDKEEFIFHPDSTVAIDEEQIDSVFIRSIYRLRGKNKPVTNYPRDVIGSHISRSGKVVENIAMNGRQKLYVYDVDLEMKKSLLNSEYRQLLMRKKALEIKKERNVAPETTVIEERPSSNPSPERPGKPNDEWTFESPFGSDKEQEKDKEDKRSDEEEFDFDFVVDYPANTNNKEKETESILQEGTPPSERDSGFIDIDNYTFEGDFETEKPDAAVIVTDTEGKVSLQSPNIAYAKEPFKKMKKKVHRFYPPNILTHRLHFKADIITTQLDNSLLFGGMDLFTGNAFDYPPPGILIKSRVQDLFEDYELEGGVRIPTTFDGLEYFVTFKDKKKQLDKHYSYYRKTSTRTYENPAQIVVYNERINTDMAIAEFKYPLDIFTSIRLRGTLRNDRRLFLSTDRISLESDPQNTQSMGVRAEFVFDNTLDIDLNLRHNTRLKVYAEAMKQMDIDFLDGFNFNFDKGFMGVVGADVRHYERLGKHAVLATRFTAAASFGSKKVLYYIGGVENALLPGFNNNIPIPDPSVSDFAFQTLASPLRGFRTNIRNGNSFAIANVELRVPLFKYFYKRPIKSSFLRNFQLVGFFDAGTAWQGFSPFTDDNPLNTDVISNPVVQVTVNYYRDPIVAGFGAGLRTKLFGYFIKLDYARGIETKQLQPGIWHLSLGTDF